jgi:hypothetical protein
MTFDATSQLMVSAQYGDGSRVTPSLVETLMQMTSASTSRFPSRAVGGFILNG